MDVSESKSHYDTTYYGNNQVKQISEFQILNSDTLRLGHWKYFDSTGTLILEQHFSKNFLEKVNVLKPGTIEMNGHRITFIEQFDSIYETGNSNSNLVPNGSFEHGLNGWGAFKTPDLFSYGVGRFGFIEPSFGSTYIGLGVHAAGWIEYAGAMLKSKLEKDSLYSIRYDYAPHPTSKFITTSFGLILSDTFSPSEPFELVSTSFLAKDTFDVKPYKWTRHVDTIRAIGYEIYVIIGFFGVTADKHNLFLNPYGSVGAYYLLDNVVVEKLSRQESNNRNLTIFYPDNGYILSAQDQTAIKEFIQTDPNIPEEVNVHGYASATGSSQSNQELSRLRAQMIHDYLVNKLEIPKSRVYMYAHGELSTDTSSRKSIIEVRKKSH